MTSDNVVSVPGEVVTTRDSPQLSVGWMSQVTMQGQGAGLLHTDTHTAPALSTVSCYHAAGVGVGGNRREYRGNIQIKICRQRCYWLLRCMLHCTMDNLNSQTLSVQSTLIGHIDNEENHLKKIFQLSKSM